MLPFDLLFPEVAKREACALRRPSDPRFSDATFLLRERYCNERDCDCRRVLLEVHWVERRAHVATLNYSFEPAKPPFDDEPQLFLDPLNPQSDVSPALHALVAEMLESDAEVRSRLVRHYEMWKSVVDDPRHPDHPKVRSRSHDDPAVRPAFPKGEPVRREGPKVGPNDPCPCGSGKKHKKCCRR